MTTPDKAFIEKFYQEAIMLLIESRSYLNGRAVHDMNSITPAYGLFISTEITRVTSRLTEIIAWLLAYKAMGNKAYQQIYKTEPKLSEDPSFTEDSIIDSPYPMPQELHHLLEETRKLYLRLLRLENTQK